MACGAIKKINRIDIVDAITKERFCLNAARKRMDFERCIVCDEREAIIERDFRDFEVILPPIGHGRFIERTRDNIKRNEIFALFEVGLPQKIALFERAQANSCGLDFLAQIMIDEPKKFTTKIATLS